MYVALAVVARFLQVFKCALTIVMRPTLMVSMLVAHVIGHQCKNLMYQFN